MDGFYDSSNGLYLSAEKSQYVKIPINDKVKSKSIKLN